MLDPSAFRFPTSRDIERLAFEANTSVAAICTRAKVSSQTFRNWKFGRVSPSLDTVQRLLAAGAAALAEANGAPAATHEKKLTQPRRKAAKPAKAKAAASKRSARRKA